MFIELHYTYIGHSGDILGLSPGSVKRRNVGFRHAFCRQEVVL